MNQASLTEIRDWQVYSASDMAILKNQISSLLESMDDLTDLTFHHDHYPGSHHLVVVRRYRHGADHVLIVHLWRSSDNVK